jgi:hypothetical protein
VVETVEHDVYRRVEPRGTGGVGRWVSMSWATLRFSKTLLRGVTFCIYVTNLGRFLQICPPDFTWYYMGLVSVLVCCGVECSFVDALSVFVDLPSKCWYVLSFKRLFDSHTLSVNIPSCSVGFLRQFIHGNLINIPLPPMSRQSPRRFWEWVKSTVGSRFATVRFTTTHLYDLCRVGPSTPDLWCITVATQASFLYLVRF